MRRASARPVLAAAVLTATVGLGACSPASPTPRLSVTPAAALFDAPFVSTVTGLQPGQRVTLLASSTDHGGAVWRSSAVFAADEGGVVSTTRAPVAGSYTRPDPMGLVETMSAPGAPAAYDLGGPTSTQFSVTISVYDGDKAPEDVGSSKSTGPVRSADADAGADARGGVMPLTQATVLRRLPGPLVKRVQLRPDQAGSDGLHAEIFLPVEPAAGPRPGIIVLGGSGGGVSTELDAQTLAAHGYPAMALAYFRAPGLPAALQRIPLEYFATAVKHLAAQPGVDPEAVALMGWSRGSEAALLTAAHFPTLVKAAVGGSPGYTSNVDPEHQTAPAWTFQGKDLPTASSQDYAYPDAASPAVIPVERIAGPILLFCGQQDGLWPSCANAQVLQQRLRARGRPTATLLSYPDAGHFVVSPLPYRPGTGSVDSTYQTDQAARADVWPKLLAFLEALATHP